MYRSRNLYISVEMKNLLLNEAFWLKVEQLCSLLELFRVWIARLESDACVISQVPEDIYAISEHLRANLPLSPFTLDEEDIFKRLE